MAIVINDDCTNCGACESECPSGAISEKADKRVIDQETCTECGICIDTCPVGAILEQ